MSRDYKPTPQRESTGSKGSPFLIGLLVGLLLGVGISVGVALMVKGSGSPFTDKVTQAPTIDQSAPAATTKPAEAAPDANAAPEKPRFDFYTILPGSESPVTEKEIADKQAKAQEAAAPNKENYFLQVGAFQTEDEADNMKAKLALLGMESVVQTANIPDKGVWHRVRVGPFTDLEQINKARTELSKNGFNSDLIKIHTTTPDQ